MSPVIAAVSHDLAAGAGLIERQLGVAPTASFALPMLLVALALAAALAWPGRLWLEARLCEQIARATLESRLAIAARAVALVLLSGATLTLSGQLAASALALAVPLLPESQVVVNALALALAVSGLGLGLGRALRAPRALPGGLGPAIAGYPFAAALTLGLTNAADQTARVLQASPISWAIVQGATLLIEAGLIAWFLLRAGMARSRVIEQATTQRKRPAVPAFFGVTALIWAALLVACGAWLAGYMRFAMLMLQELLWVGLVLPVAWLVTTFLDALLLQMSDPQRPVGRFATTVIGMRRERVRQVVLLASAAQTVLVSLLALSLIAAPLHGNRAVVIDEIRPAMLLQALQSLHLSPRVVGAALLVLVLGIALTRLVRSWLEKRFLPSTSLDIGVRTSLVTGLTYIGVLIAILSATSMLGLQLEKITLIASALSVGIGFGLQAIIQNFVSGVIMLVERPVKVGDWVAVAGAEGVIRRIRVRATELTTCDGGLVVVPNSSFITANVANHADVLTPSRLDLSLIASGSPAAGQACEAILALVEQCPLIRKEPAPELLLTAVGDGQWTFSLKAYAQSGTRPAKARSTLLFWLVDQAAGADLKIRTA